MLVRYESTEYLNETHVGVYLSVDQVLWKRTLVTLALDEYPAVQHRLEDTPDNAQSCKR